MKNKWYDILYGILKEEKGHHIKTKEMQIMHELSLIRIYPWWFITYDKGTPLMKDVNSRR